MLIFVWYYSFMTSTMYYLKPCLIHDLERLIDLIDHANLGHLKSNILEAQQMRRFLNRIKPHLPPKTTFPYPISPKGLAKYYKGILPVLIPGKDQFYVSNVKPMVKDDSNFEISQIVSEPVYNPKPSYLRNLILKQMFWQLPQVEKNT